MSKPSRSVAVVDLLGLLCYGQLVAFDQIAADAKLAPDLRKRALLSQLAAAELKHYEVLERRLAQLGVEVEVAMAPFVGPIDDFHRGTKPANWLEGLVKVVVGDGIADDFHREIAQFVNEPDRGVILDILHDSSLVDYAAEQVREAVAVDPERGDALALWARRLVGEALSQAQRVAAEGDSLVELVIDGYGDLSGVGELFKRLTQSHRARMRSLGLKS